MGHQLHPRQVSYQRFWERQKALYKRLPPGVISSYRPRADRPLWADYYPWAVGTVAEKMVFSELAKRGISFFFGGYWGDVPFTEDVYEHYRPDFVLPEYRIVIEVYGYYWHHVPGAAERDARKAIMYTASGYRYVWLWDYEIYDGVAAAINAKIPELRTPPIKTGHIFIGERPQDPRASLRAQRRSKPIVVRTRPRRPGAPRLVPPRAAWRPLLKPPKRTPTKLEPGFAGFPESYLAKLREYGKEWKEYMDKLEEYFTTEPKPVRYWVCTQFGYRPAEGDWVCVKGHYETYTPPPPSSVYPKQYKYWLRWRNYWNRWQMAMEQTPDWIEYIHGLGSYFHRFPEARYYYLSEYYRWLSWRRMGYRRY